jgi:hypothetical protein
MGDVVELPQRVLPTPVAALQSLSRNATSRLLPAWDIDDWGRDDSLVRVANLLTSARWETVVGGLELVPADGPGVFVINTRRLRLTQWLVAVELSSAIGRPVRFVGRSDTAPFGALARRLGGLLARPDEIAGALRDGQLLVIGLSGTIDPRRAGSCDPRLLAPAVERRVLVLPTAVTASDSSRTARIEISPAIAAPRRRRGPLGELELAHRIEGRVSELLDAFGGAHTGTVLDRVPWPSGGN